ncbi:HD domain-containing protein [uncultured Hyphomicrobium sp.]|uniref:HD domain-containing protein n=1 Tax=uncultured Hyphomicrobium sp. TaxID=194373 RepID=UPI0025F48CEE|nr:HD domain-containing protein [uncultured Hyphomicrobium sp.]
MVGQRIRDPLHDLIIFDNSQLERVLWKVVQTRPFQRLRRVKQLAFSELVYPGATHSRFAHSIGVFHTAKRLLEVIRRHQNDRQYEANAAQHALAAALVHDLGHGPFSHAFETVGKKLGLKMMANHELVSDALIRSSEVGEALKELGSGVPNDVANIIKGVGKRDIYSAVVSSQFDADRLDYMRRDRLMTGTQHAAIDFEWLLTNLEVGTVRYGVDKESLGEIDTFVLGQKAFYAAEAFVLGLFQLYPTVYFHKATRGAEKLFAEIFAKAVKLVLDGSAAKTGLPNGHPIVKFAKDPSNLDRFLDLDDAVVLGSLSLMCESSDTLLSECSRRLRDRKLYKCIDVRVKLAAGGGDSVQQQAEVDRACEVVEGKLLEWAGATDGSPRILIDRASRSTYNRLSESKGPLEQINIRAPGGALVDLESVSKVVAASGTFRLFRVYYKQEDAQAKEQIEKIVEGEKQR